MLRALFITLFSPLVLALWPIPRWYADGISTVVIVDLNNVQIQFNQPHLSSTNCVDTSDKVYSAVNLTLGLLKDGFVPRMLHPFNKEFEPPIAELLHAQKLGKLVITQRTCDVSFIPMAGEVNESYSLSIPADSAIATIDAESSLGVLWALQTFNQLFYTHTNGELYTTKAPIKIFDEPRLAHRGINLDLSRHFLPKETVLSVIEAMSWQKFNRFHMHITDSQSWPLEIPSIPELAQKGAYGEGIWYTPADLAEILDYANARGIQTYLEIDMPGHTNSISYSHPELIAASNIQPNWNLYANQPPSGQLKLNNSDVRDFMATIIADVLPRTRHGSNYFHTGGDEVNVNVYNLDPGINSNVSSVIQPYLSEFVLGIHDQILAANRTPIVWEEMLLFWNLTLSPEVVVQVWQSAKNLQLVTQKGYKAIAGSYDYWYLDCGKGQWLDFPPSVYDTFYPFLDYCNPVKNWKLIYSYDPLYSLTREEASLVIGGEIHLWTEQTDQYVLDSRLWPRACAAGEVLWSGNTDEMGVNRSLVDVSIRLQEWRERMVRRGILAEPFTQQWCVQRPEECSFPAAATENDAFTWQREIDELRTSKLRSIRHVQYVIHV